MDWAALAPYIDHPAREAIIEVIRWIGEPLSAPDLWAILEDPELSLGQVTYHAKSMVIGNCLISPSERVTTTGIEPLYCLPPRP